MSAVVELEGVYRPFDARMRPRGELQPTHATLTLDDGTELFIEAPWSAEARRSPEELALAGRRVRVRGLRLSAVPEPEIPVASLEGPCLVRVESVRPV